MAAVRGGQYLRPRLRPGYGYYTAVRERIDANRACLSQARRIVRQAVHMLADLGDGAF